MQHFFLLSTHATLQLKGWKKCLRDFAIHKETNKRSRALPQWWYLTTTPLRVARGGFFGSGR